MNAKQENSTTGTSSEGEKTYIIVMRDTRYWLVGPFLSVKAAGVWGRRNNPTDDARWQTISLADPTLAPRLVSPLMGPMEE